MRHRRRSSVLPTRVHRSVVGLAAVGLLASGTLSAPGAIEGAELATEDAGTLTWFVEDEAGSAVHSTTFEVTGPDGWSLEVGDNHRDDTNTTHGTLTIAGLPLGEYTVSPTGGPEGIELGDAQTAQVTEDGQDAATPITFVATPAVEDEPVVEEPVVEEPVVEEPVVEEPVVEEPVVEEPVVEEPVVEEPVVEEPATDPEDETSEGADQIGAVADLDDALTVAPMAIPPGTPGSNEAHLLVRKGGDRVGTSNNVTALTGATFSFYRVNNDEALTGGTFVGSCTTEPGGNGVCGIQVPLNFRSNYFYVAETSAPAGWTAPGTWGTNSEHVRYNTGAITRNGSTNSRIRTLPGSDRTFPDVRDNPALPAQCGLNIALVYDLSNSVTDYPDLFSRYKAAGVGFVNALEGTPSSIGLYTFATNAPANGAANGSMPLTSVATSGQAVRSRINGLTATPQTDQGGTNWDVGLAQVDAAAYDAVLFLTDGDPTFRRGGEGLGHTSTIREVEEAIHSANKVKAETSLIVVGIRNGEVSGASAKRLSLLSSDYHTSNFDAVGELLREVALENCLGTLTVVKQERALDGTLTPGQDWTFSTADADVSPASGQTDGNGAVNFEVGGFTDDITERAITVSEIQQPGFSLEQQNGYNATCTDNVSGNPVPVSNGGVLGFTVDVAHDAAISCQMINTQHPTVTLQKSWVDAVEGDTATLTINGQPTAPPVVSTVGDTPTFDDTTNIASLIVQPGESVNVTEVLGGDGTYTTSLSCDGADLTYTDGELSGSFTMPANNVACTFTNALVLDDLTVSKTVNTSYDRAYTWDIEKVAGSERYNTPEGTPATVDYDVTVSAVDQAETNVSITGQITVTNDNSIAFTGVDVVDSLPGANCTVTGGSGLTVPAGDSVTVDYACTADNIVAVGGTNTATATWEAGDHPGTSGEAEGSAPVSFDGPATEIDRYVTVTDAFDGGAPELLPLPGGAEALDWVQVDADGGSVLLEYTQQVDGVPGACTTYTNNATIVETEQDTSADVEVCVGADLSIDKNVVVSMDRSYGYDLVKNVDETQLNVDPETGEATFNYTVTVTDSPAADSNWQMSGQITVVNPNDWPVTADVTDTVDNGGECTVTGGVDAVIPANGSAVLDYSCTFEQQPDYDGTNTATVTWDAEEYFSPSGEATGTADFVVGDWSVTPINQTVTVVDDKTDPANPVELGTHTWTQEGASQEFTYPLTLAGTEGTCVDYTNTAWLHELPDNRDEQTVTVCWPLDLTVEKTVDAHFDRAYAWLLEKEVDETIVVIGDDESATFNYTVSATPNGITDSAWSMSGEITVTNPNSTAVTTAVTDLPDVGGGAVCTVADPTLEVPADGAATTTYECTFTEQPDYTGGTNTATISWTDVNGDAQSTSDVADVEFEGAEADRTVPVFDDKVTEAAPGVLLGVSDYYAGPFSYTYPLTLEGVAGECTAYTNTAVIPALELEDDQTVTVCVELGPEVSKTAEADYDREYLWDLTKVADETEVTITDGGEATFDYVITATPDGTTDSGWTLGGAITVSNPNVTGDMTVTVTDIPDVGGECTVVDGEGIVLAPGDEVVLDYTCSFAGQPDYSGTNTATVAWSTAAGQSGTATADAPIEFVIDDETNLTVDVYDDEATGGEPTEPVGTAHYYDGPHTFDYELSFPGVPGECTNYTNTAVIADTGDEAQEIVTVCVEAAPEVSKTVTATYDREYFWDITKVADATEVEIVGTEAIFDYVITAIPGDFADSNWQVSGGITVTNPNDFAELTVTVTDEATLGEGCTVVDGAGVVLEPGETRVLDYTCDVPSQPDYDGGTNTAHVAWTAVDGTGQVTSSDPVDIDFALANETNVEVEVYDDEATGGAPTLLLGTANWHAGPTDFAHQLTLPGVAGECVTHTNTAVIEETGDEAQADVTLCVEDGLVITKDAVASYDREYLWDLQKEADETVLTIGEDGTATFDYTVTATPDPEWVDSGWEMDGQISVTNPNAYAEGTVSVVVTDESTVGGVCAVTEGEDVVLAPGETRVFDYTCTVTEQPAYEGSNTASVTWTGPDGEQRSSSVEVPVTFVRDQTVNETVDIHDDKVTGQAPGEYLDTATWNPDGTPVVVEYSLSLPGEAGTCVDHTNTAILLDTDYEDQETVTVCSTLAPIVEKDAEATFDRLYNWDVTKEADQTEVTIGEDGTASINYVVTAQPLPWTDSNWAMSGQISVTNPNTFADGAMTVTVTDVPGVGGQCTVAEGQDVVLDPGETRSFNYSCTFEDQPDYAGTNTADVAWTGPEDLGGTVSAEAEVSFTLDGETNLEVDVHDDKVTGEVPGQLLWSAHYYDGPFEFTYPMDFEGVPGECTDYTNVARIPAAGAEDDETVTVCVELEPEVTKTADASYDREYFWDITKVADATNVEIVGEEATFNYVVSAIADGFVDSGWEMSGQITVTNPNAFQEMTVTVTDIADVGGTCTVDGAADVVLEAGETQTFDYTCAFDAQPTYEGTNTAHVAWTDHEGTDQVTSSDPVAVTFELDGETNVEVEVYDDKVTLESPGDLLGTAIWHDGTTDFAYENTLQGVAGECVTHTNTAVIPATGDEAQAGVTICVEDEVVIAKTVETAFDREFFWDLAKEADETELTIGEDGTATFDYTVSATPDPEFVDSNWTMAGQVTVTNPNAYDEGTVTVEITDESTVGGTCVVADGADVVLEPGETRVFDYECSFAEQPAYEGSNTATVTWTGPDGEQRSSSVEVPVTFTNPDETNKSVEVYDDKVTGVAPGHQLGTAEWNAEGTPVLFTYNLPLPGEAGTCVEHTNTAVIPATGDEAQETVTVCSTLAPEVAKTAEADFDRTYDWDITKEVDRTHVVLTEEGTAQFNYVVSATPDGYADSGWTMGGEVSVTNPNTFDGGELTVTVTDVPSVGGECAVADAEGVVLAPAETRTFDYSCTFEEQPEYAGTNLATVAWSGPGDTSGTATAEADVQFVLDGETHLDVDVYDDKVTGEAPGELLGTAHWHDGVTEFAYALDLPGEVGSCVDHTNTAVILDSTSAAGFLAPQAVGDEDSVTVTVCVEAAPEVSKTADADFDREYFWDLTKVADATEVEIVGEEATFSYVVSAVADGFADSGWAMSGEITVTNPNDFQELAVTVTDVATVGGDCVVAEGEDVVLAPGETRVLGYECTFGEQPAYEGSNTAHVAWTDADGTDQVTSSDPVEVSFDLDDETNLEVEVFDDQVFEEGDGVLLGTANWHDGTTEFGYDLTLPGVPGECVTHTNTAVIPATGDEAEAGVTICVEDDLVITKSADAHFDRTYDWDLAKVADQTQVTIGADGTAQFDYLVSATPGGFTDSNWSMTGQISVTNPNAYAEGTVSLQVTDESTVGGSCEVVDGEGVVVAPGATQVFDYACTFEEQPAYEGSNSATVTWGGPDGAERTVTTEVPVTFALDQETNTSVEVYDDKVTGEAPGELLGTAVWNADGTPTLFDYSLDLPGEAGTCVDHTNTAVIPDTGDGAEEVVTVCVEAAPEASKTASASYDRSYDWLLDKEVDRTTVELPEPGTAEFNYVVTATPDGYSDSGWEMSGQVTVTNPNDFQEMAVTVTDQATVGGSCVVAEGEDVVLAAGETRVLDYECTFTEPPAYEGSNTAVVTWTDPEGAEQSISSEAVEVSFELDEESNLEVEVYDDMVTGEAPGELLGTADWRDGPTEFGYSLKLEGVADECVDYTNTAVIPATGDEAKRTVEVCVEEAAPEPPIEPGPVDPTPPVEPEPVDPTPPVEPEPVDPTPPAQPAPIIPTGDPVASGPRMALVASGLGAMILALVGAAFFLRRRQD